MLRLKNIVKTYDAGENAVTALRGIDLDFRDCEFVSVLGPSGCGKTTMLNIIGGLDRYTSGNLLINGRSTKEYKDADWDAYRNHSVGFVFQSYNLIPHQSVLANVELALTLSGVGRAERRRRAEKALIQVGLGDKLSKRPSQMSGGQMQRVAIARALVNDPEILLADEPTGALDTETSTQVMELLKEVSRDRLVIMVTHNPELAEKYSTRIVRLLDGKVTGDTMPVTEEELRAGEKVRKDTKGKKSMSFLTALSLSFNNLMTKRTRTLLTSFAGSIGIIGIALILALSTGAQAYIDSVQKDTLSSYPITIESEQSDLTSLFGAFTKASAHSGSDHDSDAVYSSSQMYTLFNSIVNADTSKNDLTALKKYLDRELDPETSTTGLYEYVSSAGYGYDVKLNAYVKGTDGKYMSCDISNAFSQYSSADSAGFEYYGAVVRNMTSLNLWTELLPGAGEDAVSDVSKDQYELLYGQWPETADEIVLIVDSNNEISDLAFYALGLVDADEVRNVITSAAAGTEIDTEERRISYEDVLGIGLKLVTESELYTDGDGDGVFTYAGGDAELSDMIVKNGYDLHIVGVVRNNAGANASLATSFGYTTLLTQHIMDVTAQSAVVKAQSAPENENLDVLSGLPFIITEALDPTDEYKASAVLEYFSSLDDTAKTELYIKMLSKPSDEYLESNVNTYMQQYDTREKMEQLAAETYGMDAETMKSYLSSYSDEELYAMIRAQIVKLVESTYAEKAADAVNSIMNTPSAEESAYIAGQIMASLDSREKMIYYVLADWQENTSMGAQAIMTYLSGLSDTDLYAAAYGTAERAAADTYASMPGAYSAARYAKAAAAFDASYGAQTDTAVLAGYYDLYMPSSVSSTTLADNMALFGSVSADTPTSISLYSTTFEGKDEISRIIKEYNSSVPEDEQISYTDYVALLMSGITDIINAISYVLIGFVAISLVVSSIMIGIITYISVLERTKEIGVLRSIGASKRDVSLVFNAETLIVGFAAGAIGIGISLLLCIPINLIVHALTGVMGLSAFIPANAAVILVAISMALTLIAGLIPSRIASKKDPVEALRTE